MQGGVGIRENPGQGRKEQKEARQQWKRKEIPCIGASRKSDLRSTGLGEWKIDGALGWLGRAPLYECAAPAERGRWRVPSWDVAGKVTSKAKRQLVHP